MRKILSALLSNITGQRPGSTNTNIRYVKQSDAALTRKFFSDNLRRIIVLSLIPLTLLGSLSIFITDRYIRHSVEQNSESQLNQLNELTQVIPTELDSLSLSFDKDPKIKIRLQTILNTVSFSFEELEALFYLRNVIDVPANSKPYIHSIYIYYNNPYGRFLSTRDGIAQLDSSLDKSWYAYYQSRSFENEELVTQLRELKSSSHEDHATEVITVYKPFAPANSGKFHGLIVMNIVPSYFEKSFLQFNQWPGSYYYIADSTGKPLIQSNDTQVVVPIPQESESNSRLVQGGLVRFIHDDAWVSIKQAPRLAWRAVSVIPTKALYSLPHTIVYITVALSLLSLLLSALYALWITRKNYRQISQIVNVLDAVDRIEEPTPAITGNIHDVYELIVKNILDTFLEQKYLRVQLSERQAKMELLELKALQSQMNPHFMSNTLHSIYWKAFQLTRSPNDACLMIEQLSDLLEYALQAADDYARLQDELANVRGYVELQRTRFAERLSVLWDVDEGIEACRVVKISLQPLVENSIHIGLEAQQQLTVKIKCRMLGTQLKVTVIDNGPGMSKERLAQIRHSFHSESLASKHVGLLNTSKRLSLHYASGDLLRVLSKQGLGTAVTLTFPQQLDEDSVS
ncbi:putative sensor-like histidine kinase [compost metagenome]